MLRTLRYASEMIRRTSLIGMGKDPMSGWRESVEARETRRVYEVLNIFGLDRICSDSDEPRAADVWSLGYG